LSIYRNDFPSFFLPLSDSNGSLDHNGETMRCLVVDSKVHTESFGIYRKRSDQFFLTIDQRARNFTHAHRVVEFFNEQKQRAAKGEEFEEIVLVIDGIAHLFGASQVAAAAPSVIDILSNLGVTAGCTFALRADETLDVNVNPETGIITAEIVKKEGLETPSP
jgi:hypothetical protein